MIKVMIADDHSVVRKGLKHLIQEQDDMEMAGEASNGQDALTLVRREGGDVLVLDVLLPLLSGLEVLQEVRHSQPELPVLMVSVYAENEMGIRMLKAGAAGYISKTMVMNELVPAIRKVAGGGKYVSPALAEHFAFSLGDKTSKTPQDMLSDREYAVIRMMGASKPLSDIARELGVSMKTISTYRVRALHKLGLKSNAELTRYVIEHDLT